MIEDCGAPNENKVIWKYAFDFGATQHSIPVAGKILDVQVQGGVPCMWVEVSPDSEREYRWFHIVGTGHQEILAGWDHVGTFQSPPFVWHVYEDRQARRPINQEKTRVH